MSGTKNSFFISMIANEVKDILNQKKTKHLKFIHLQQ
jgi:hypothetical protein